MMFSCSEKENVARTKVEGKKKHSNLERSNKKGILFDLVEIKFN